MQTLNLIHISAKRYEQLRSQGWKMPSAYHVLTREGDTVFHIGHDTVDDVWLCKDCGTMVQSVKVSTPAELEELKARTNANNN